MRDFLTDIVKHTYALGFIDLIKVEGNEDSTILSGAADDKSVILTAVANSPIEDFTGLFGIPNLGQLNTLLSLAEYKEKANITVRSNGETPTDLHFENNTGDFKNDFRFMGPALVNEKLKPMKFNEPAYEVEIEPSMMAIARLKQQAQANSDEPLFAAVVKKGDLIFKFGDHSSNAGEFIFASDVSSSLSTAWKYPVQQTLSILSLDGDKTMQFSNLGALVITVNSGLIEYKYILSAFTK